jgi:hypothetical protein
MNYTTVIVRAFHSRRRSWAAAEIYLGARGVRTKEVVMYFETNILDLPNKRGKSLTSMIHMQATYLKGGYVIRETEVVMFSRPGVARLRG